MSIPIRGPLSSQNMQRTRKALLASLLVATAVALGYALAAVPNVELMTVTVFIAGYLLGAGAGVLVGMAAIALYSTFNPLGAAPVGAAAESSVGVHRSRYAGVYVDARLPDYDERCGLFVVYK